MRKFSEIMNIAKTIDSLDYQSVFVTIYDKNRQEIDNYSMQDYLYHNRKTVLNEDDEIEYYLIESEYDEDFEYDLTIMIHVYM